MIGTRIRFAALALVAAILLTAGIARAQNADLYLAPADGAYDPGADFGSSAAISNHIAAVGAPGYGQVLSSSDSPPYVGVVNVYTTDAKRTTWTLTQVLHAGSATSEYYFGSGVALSDNRLVVTSASFVWIYENGPEGFVLRDRFSASAASSNIIFQGDVLAFHQQLPNKPEVVVVYRVNERCKARLVSILDPPSGGSLGGEIAFDPTRQTFAIGGGSGNAGDPGDVYFFALRGDHWAYQETLQAPSTTASGFGTGVSLWGKRLVVGAPFEDFLYEDRGDLIVNSGVVHVYRRERGQWVQTQTISTADPTSPVYGLVDFGSALATNGPFVWITAPQANDQHYSVVQAGYSSLFRWDKGQLNIFKKEAAFTSGGGLDMSRRYVIEGFVYIFIQQQSATIVDLKLLEGSRTPTASDGSAETE